MSSDWTFHEGRGRGHSGPGQSTQKSTSATAALFGRSSAGGVAASIADLVQEAASQHILSQVPPGFVYLAEYDRFYNYETGYYFDVTSKNYCHAITQVRWIYDESTGAYTEHCPPGKWSTNRWKRRADRMFGKKAAAAFDQHQIDACEVVLGIVHEIEQHEEESQPDGHPTTSAAADAADDAEPSVEDQYAIAQEAMHSSRPEKKTRRDDGPTTKDIIDEMELETIFGPDGEPIVITTQRSSNRKERRRLEQQEGKNKKRDRSRSRSRDRRRRSTSRDRTTSSRRDQRRNEATSNPADEAFFWNVAAQVHAEDARLEAAERDEDDQLLMMQWRQDERLDEAPAIRVVDSDYRLFMVTKEGGMLGRHKTCAIHVDTDEEQPIDKKHVLFYYDEEWASYVLEVRSSRAPVRHNNAPLNKGDRSWVSTGDVLAIGDRLWWVLHIHHGYNSCAGCDPSTVRTWVLERERALAAAERSKHVVRMHTAQVLRQMHEEEQAEKKKQREEQFGYIDRAQLRRQRVGTIPMAQRAQSAGYDASAGIYARCAARPLTDAVDLSVPTSRPSVPPPPSKLGAENKGFRLLQSMGWSEGQGLGRLADGRVEPVATDSRNSRAGLGAQDAPTSAANASKQKPASARDRILEITRQRYSQHDQHEDHRTS